MEGKDSKIEDLTTTKEEKITTVKSKVEKEEMKIDLSEELIIKEEEIIIKIIIANLITEDHLLNKKKESSSPD